MNTINFFDKEKADSLCNLGFKYIKQRVGEDRFVYTFINTLEIMRIVDEKFSENDYYLGRTLNF